MVLVVVDEVVAVERGASGKKGQPLPVWSLRFLCSSLLHPRVRYGHGIVTKYVHRVVACLPSAERDVAIETSSEIVSWFLWCVHESSFCQLSST